jgi:hypothetical protein
MIKKLIFYTISICVPLIVSLFIIECILRLFFPQQEAMRWFKSNDKYGYVLKSNFYQEYKYIDSNFSMIVITNSFGHRYPQYDSVNLQNKTIHKVLILGDSFGFGHGLNIQDTFAFILDSLLSISSEKFMIINSSVGGWGTIQETNYARDHLKIFNPDVIVLTFCGNDPNDDKMFENNLSDMEKGTFYFPGKILLKENLHVYRLIYSKYYIAFHNYQLKRKSKNVDLNKDKKFDPQSASIISETDWNITLSRLLNFYHDFKEFNHKGIMLILATAPWDNNIRENLKTITNNIDRHYVDLYEDTIIIPEQERRLKHDGHWSKKIHQISAEKLSKYITKYSKLFILRSGGIGARAIGPSAKGRSGVQAAIPAH